MSKIIDEDNSIEGKKISGQSRKPLVITTGIEMCIGDDENIPVYKFKAKFDVRATVLEEITSNCSKIIEDSIIILDSEVICEDAVVYSLTKNYTPKLSKGSATHQSNFWNFSKQTAIEILKSHIELKNSKEKRNID